MLSKQRRRAALILRDDFGYDAFEIVDNFEQNGVRIEEGDLIQLFPPGNTPKHSLTYRGETLTVREWSARTGIPVTTLHKRRRLNWNTDRILTTPVRRQHNNRSNRARVMV